MAPVVIRDARAADAAAIANLTRQLGYDVTEAEAVERLARMLLRDDQRIFVADRDGRVVGWVHAVLAQYIDTDAFVMIGGLVVDRDHRRMGVGQALMNHAEAWAARHGCSMVHLSSSASRRAAHQFYETLGYTNVKTQFAFAKPLSADAATRVKKLIPRVEPAG
jgi:predicted N-acetyltransferase YhbS